MSRRCLHLLLIIALLFQALLVLSPAQVSDQAQILEHALVHEAGVGHHHHDEQGSLHGDYDIDSAVFHVHHDPVSQIACLPQAVALAIDLRPAALDMPHVENLLTAPYLDGPLRPPRTPA
jgi:hypothetical protein